MRKTTGYLNRIPMRKIFQWKHPVTQLSGRQSQALMATHDPILALMGNTGHKKMGGLTE